MCALSDEYGRRPITLICLFTAFICHVLASIAPNYYIFISLRFFIGASSDTFYSVRTTLTCELLPSRSRAWITVIQNIAWVSGMFWVGILSLFIHEWRLMYFACAAPGILAILYYL
ncbi:MFS domain-containing protein [Trichostrongylus colubriformis]|uniref:MFS domain-containing protein n=1 Tax=Trichostrongylus colubriformis TaxID=6319 RepID=A0AAN8FK39_TRICO